MDEAVLVIFLLPGFCVPSSSLSEYYFINDNRTWYEANNYCTSHYTAIAQIQNTEDVQKLSNNSQAWFRNDKAWIGLYGGVSEWNWLDGTAARFVFWDHGGPLNVDANAFCVAMNPKGYWNNRDCSETKTHVCHFGGPDFRYNKEKMTWNESKTLCEQQGGILAIIPNNTIHLIVKDVIGLNEAWIGLRRHPMTFWYWSESGINYAFTNWQYGQPDNLNVTGSCAAALSNGSWTDEPCNSTFPFFCTNAIAVNTEKTVFDPASDQKSRKTVVRMKIQSSANMEDPAHRAKLLQQLRAALANQGVTDVNLTWKKQPVKQARECNDNKDPC